MMSMSVDLFNFNINSLSFISSTLASIVLKFEPAKSRDANFRSSIYWAISLGSISFQTNQRHVGYERHDIRRCTGLVHGGRKTRNPENA